MSKETVRRSELMRLLREVKSGVAAVKRAQSEISKFARFLELLGIAAPVIGTGGPFFFLVAFLMPIIATVAQKAAEAEALKAEKRLEKENERMRQQWIREIMVKIEHERGAAYRSVMPK